MIVRTAIFFLGLALLCSCGGKHSRKGSSSSASGGNASSNSTSKNSNSGKFSSQRGAASSTQSLPTLGNTNPLAFTPSGTLASAPAKMDLGLSSQKIIVPDDGRSWNYPACSYPIPAPGHGDPSKIVIDGELGDWPSNSLVGIDRLGDGVANSAAFDLRAVYWAQDSNYYYIGVQVGDTWPMAIDTDQDRLTFQFSSITLPTDGTSMPSTTVKLTLDVFGTTLYEEANGSVTQVPQGTGGSPLVDYTLKAQGSEVEFKIARSTVDSLMGGNPFSVNVFTSNPTSDKTDQAGPFLVGFQDDYACLVPVPDTAGKFSSFKMFIMHRTGDVQAQVAEIAYRAMISAAPYATSVVQDPLDYWDTNNVIAIAQMDLAGLYVSSLGFFLQSQPNDYTGQVGIPLTNFFIAAHEFLHSYNASDYKLPTFWSREGHSNWFATQVLDTYHGHSVFQQEYRYDVYDFLNEENTLVNPITTLADATWLSKPNTSLYYYRKAATFLSLLLNDIGYTNFLDNIFFKGENSTPFADNNELLSAITTQLTTAIGGNGNLQAGWFGVPYSNSAVPLSLIGDSDNDGLFNYQEAVLGTDPNKIDSDGDGLSDTGEWVIGTNPLKKDNYSYLLADNYLGDWQVNSPSNLRQGPGNNKSCPNYATISKYGLVLSGPWILAAVELAAVPTDSTTEVVLFITEPNRNSQVDVQFGLTFYDITNTDTNKLIRPGFMMAPFTGNQLEIAINLSWMGWTSAPPNGTKFQIGTFVKGSECDQTDTLGPTVL